MTLEDAQREMRLAYRRGSVGQLVTGFVWLFSAAMGTGVDKRLGIAGLALGGMAIFPLTQLALGLRGDRPSLSPANRLARYAFQSVFAMFALYPLVYAAALHNLNWFYPACMLVVSAHYVSFIFLYGMWEYGLLAGLLGGGGVVLGIFFPNNFGLGGWVAASALLLFALAIGRHRDAERPDRSAVVRPG